MIVVLDLAADAVRRRRYDESPPETGKTVDGSGSHGSVP
jgi:hypothetical protein